MRCVDYKSLIILQTKHDITYNLCWQDSSKISIFWPIFVAEQVGLGLIWSKILKTFFPAPKTQKIMRWDMRTVYAP